MSLEDRIYKILYKNSRVDGIRVLNEDEWPIEELLALIEDVLLNFSRWEQFKEFMKDSTAQEPSLHMQIARQNVREYLKSSMEQKDKE